MQSLSLANIRKSRLIQIHRGDTRDAYAMKNRSSCAIRSALAQCKVLRSGGAGDAPFSNCVLARLYHMLCEIDPDAASEVEGVVKR